MNVGKFNEAARNAWIERVLKELPPGSRILDAGAGEQPYRRFCAHLRYVAQDFARYDPMANTTGLQKGSWDYGCLDIISDVTAIPVASGSFDAILCTEVLEHISSPVLAIKEFARLLRLGGQLILTAPFCSLTHFAPFHFNTGFNRYFYEEHLPEFGFEILELSPNGNYFEFMAQELRRLPEVAARYSRIRMRFWNRALIQLLLFFLQRCSRRDKGSAELLAFGYHLRAVKRKIHSH